MLKGYDKILELCDNFIAEDNGYIIRVCDYHRKQENNYVPKVN